MTEQREKEVKTPLWSSPRSSGPPTRRLLLGGDPTSASFKLLLPISAPAGELTHTGGSTFFILIVTFPLSCDLGGKFQLVLKPMMPLGCLVRLKQRITCEFI